MFKKRSDVFETNSSSTHSITLVTKPLPEKTLPIDDEGYVTLEVNGFCSTDFYSEPSDKLGYVLQVFACKNGICLNEQGNSEVFRNALTQLYNTEEFKDLEERIKDRLGPSCKGIRFDESYGWGYIDDSYDAVEEFCTYKEYDAIEFIFGNYYLSYEYDG